MVTATFINRRRESRAVAHCYNLHQRFDRIASGPAFAWRTRARDYDAVARIHIMTGFFEELQRRKVYRVAAAYIVVAEFLIQIALAAPNSIFAATKNNALSQLAGYRVVPVHYAPPNKMIMSFRINGQSANLLVDTGASQLILDAAAAESFGIKPSQRNLVEESAEGINPGRYTRFTQINGQDLPVAIAQSLTAGSMNFGSSLVALRSSKGSGARNGGVDGVLGLDILLRHKAVINCETRLVFFKVDPARQMHLSAAASSAKFTRVPLRREENGALTAPCSLRGQSARLLVDTGAFVTTFHESFIKSLGIASEPTKISVRLPGGTTQPIQAARINDLTVGNFKMPPHKIGVTTLPNFIRQQGSGIVGGILGMDMLYICHAIVDLDSMSLFLK